MKTEMQMPPNGNYESVILYVQHECRSPDYHWKCIQYASDMKNLVLKGEFGDPYESDGCIHEVSVNFCPFCGYKAELKS